MKEMGMAQLTGKGSLIAGALAAIGASVCCVGPLQALADDLRAAVIRSGVPAPALRKVLDVQ
jgi:mercuric ion transport protein